MWSSFPLRLCDFTGVEGYDARRCLTRGEVRDPRPAVDCAWNDGATLTQKRGTQRPPARRRALALCHLERALVMAFMNTVAAYTTPRSANDQQRGCP